MEITKREIIASIAIVAIMFVIGFFISDKITDYENDKNAEYQKAIHIEDSELFQYGMDTNIGNAFVYGDLEAVDTVTYPEIGGEYMLVEKVKEKYTMHTRTYTVRVGKTTQTRVQTYWTWDRVGSEEIKCNEIKFCGIIFKSNKVELPLPEYVDMIKESSHIRYKYYGVPKNILELYIQSCQTEPSSIIPNSLRTTRLMKRWIAAPLELRTLYFGLFG